MIQGQPKRQLHYTEISGQVLPSVRISSGAGAAYGFNCDRSWVYHQLQKHLVALSRKEGTRDRLQYEYAPVLKNVEYFGAVECAETWIAGVWPAGESDPFRACFFYRA